MLVRGRRPALGLGACVLALSACTPVASWDFQTVPPSDASRATISAQPSGAKRVDPGQRIVVTASEGQLSTVSVVGPKGPIKGELSADGTVWTATKRSLDFGATYTVQSTAVDPRGATTSQTDQFRTLEPKDFFAGTVLPAEGTQVGVGMPITVTFDRSIKNRLEVEQAMIVRTPTPIEGAWTWRDATTAQFRPSEFWPGNIPVTVDLNFKGVQAAKGIYGDANASTTFAIGPSMVTKISAETHQAKVIRDGEKIRTIPITTGKAGFETRSGVKVIVSKERTRIMDAATGGTDPNDPEYYRLEVEYAMRVTYSGEFVHAAPWSQGSQGYANVSHGCIGMSTANALWLYDQSEIGDVVVVTGTSVPQNLGNGITVWNEPWEDWLAGSATGAVMTTASAPATPTPDATPIPAATPTPDATPNPAATAVAQAAYPR